MAVAPDQNAAFAEFAHPERLVTTEWLAEHLGEPGLAKGVRDFRHPHGHPADVDAPQQDHVSHALTLAPASDAPTFDAGRAAADAPPSRPSSGHF